MTDSTSKDRELARELVKKLEPAIEGEPFEENVSQMAVWLSESKVLAQVRLEEAEWWDGLFIGEAILNLYGQREERIAALEQAAGGTK